MLELSRIVPRAYLELVLLRDFLLYALVVVAKMVVEPLHHSTAVIYSLAALRGQPPPPTRHLLRATLVHDTQYTVPNGHLVSG